MKVQNAMLFLLGPWWLVADSPAQPPAGKDDGVTQSVTAAPPPEGFSLSGDAERGKALFLKKCTVCHGDNGDGNGRIKLDPPPRDLRDTERMRKRSDWQVYLVIRDGGAALGLSSKMFPWRKLASDQEIHDIAVYVRTLTGSAETGSVPEDPADAALGHGVCGYASAHEHIKRGIRLLAPTSL